MELSFGLAALDVSTGEYWISEFHGAQAQTPLLDELARLEAKELLVRRRIVPGGATLDGRADRPPMLSLNPPSGSIWTRGESGCKSSFMSTPSNPLGVIRFTLASGQERPCCGMCEKHNHLLR